MTKEQIEAIDAITSTDNLDLDDDGEYRLTVDGDQDLDDLRAVLPGWEIDWAGEGNTDADGETTEDIFLKPPAGEDHEHGF